MKLMKLIYRINRHIPVGGLTIAKLTEGNNTVTLTNNGWVITSDGKSKDMLPVTLVSQGLVNKFQKELGIPHTEEGRRTLFEAWCQHPDRARSFPVDPLKDGLYPDRRTQCAWEGYKEGCENGA